MHKIQKIRTKSDSYGSLNTIHKNLSNYNHPVDTTLELGYLVTHHNIFDQGYLIIKKISKVKELVKNLKK